MVSRVSRDFGTPKTTGQTAQLPAKSAAPPTQKTGVSHTSLSDSSVGRVSSNVVGHCWTRRTGNSAIGSPRPILTIMPKTPARTNSALSVTSFETPSRGPSTKPTWLPEKSNRWSHWHQSESSSKSLSKWPERATFATSLPTSNPEDWRIVIPYLLGKRNVFMAVCRREVELGLEHQFESTD